ncbi:MAG: DUF1538 domain-containing protein [Magnetococcus sp. MYC-9]
MEILLELLSALAGTFMDLVPIVAAMVGFQLLVLRQPIANWRRMAIGILYTYIGLVLFIVGLEKSLLPVGEAMARQLSDPLFLFNAAQAPPDALWSSYGWVYLFAALIGFSATLAEPALLAVATKACDVSQGAIKPFPLRMAVATGVAIGIALGAFRIVTGIPIAYCIVTGYVVVIIQTCYAPRMIVALAYDSGSVTTSTVTVPLVAALGLGLAATIPGRNPALDGLGLIVFATLFPVMTVMGYAQLVECLSMRTVARRRNAPPLPKRCGLGRKTKTDEHGGR